MPPANPRIYNAGTTTVPAPIDLGELLPGEESAVQSYDVWNEGAGVETLHDVSIGVQESEDGGATWIENGPASTGRWVEVEVYGVIGSAVAQTVGYTPVGGGARVHLKEIPAAAARKIRAKAKLPVAPLSDANRKVRVVLHYSEASVRLSDLYLESGAQGIWSGAGDRGFGAVVRGGAIAASSPVDPDVEIAETEYRYRGESRVAYAQTITPAASGAGNSRWITVSLGDDPTTPTLTASAEVAGTAPITDRLPHPAGEALLGWVLRDDGVNIDAADVTSDPDYQLAELTTSGLSATVSAIAAALVDNRRGHRDSDQSANLVDAATNVVYLTPAGGLQIINGEPTDARALPLYAVTTAGGVETARVDLRRYLGPAVWEFVASFVGPVTVGDAVYGVSPSRRVRLFVPSRVRLSVGDMVGATAGELVLDLEKGTGAGVWTSLYSAAAERPRLAFNASPPYTGEATPPNTTILEPGTPLRWRVATVPTGGGTAPVGVAAGITWEEAPQ